MHPQPTSILDCFNTLAHELECDPNYSFSQLSDLNGETFPQKLARVRRALEAIDGAAKTLRKWAPECFPADANGQVHFARALMESVAGDLEGKSDVSVEEIA